MAKLTGPLICESASGSLGKTLTIQRMHGATIAKRWAQPNNAPSQAQIDCRAAYLACITSWHALDAPAKLTWDTTGKAAEITGFSAFMSDCLLTPPPTGAATWDGGATIWDGGATVWDA